MDAVDHRSPAERREDERNLAYVAKVKQREAQLARDSRILRQARRTVAGALADIPAEVPRNDYVDGYWDGLKTAYSNILEVLGVGE